MTPANKRQQDAHREAGRTAANHMEASQHARHKARENVHEAPASTHELAARSVMHPDGFDPEWRYYHGAWGG